MSLDNEYEIFERLYLSRYIDVMGGFIECWCIREISLKDLKAEMNKKIGTKKCGMKIIY